MNTPKSIQSEITKKQKLMINLRTQCIALEGTAQESMNERIERLEDNIDNLQKQLTQAKQVAAQA